MSAELLQLLTEELREVAVLRLLGYRNSEIAVQFRCSERSIDRKLNAIREMWESSFVD
ncbi:MAG: ECF-type sigma factor [Planctomycetaceae bacterium]